MATANSARTLMHNENVDRMHASVKKRIRANIFHAKKKIIRIKNKISKLEAKIAAGKKPLLGRPYALQVDKLKKMLKAQETIVKDSATQWALK